MPSSRKMSPKDETKVIVNRQLRSPSPEKPGSPISIRAESPKNVVTTKKEKKKSPIKIKISPKKGSSKSHRRSISPSPSPRPAKVETPVKEKRDIAKILKETANRRANIAVEKESSFEVEDVTEETLEKTKQRNVVEHPKVSPKAKVEMSPSPKKTKKVSSPKIKRPMSPKTKSPSPIKRKPKPAYDEQLIEPTVSDRYFETRPAASPSPRRHKKTEQFSPIGVRTREAGIAASPIGGISKRSIPEHITPQTVKTASGAIRPNYREMDQDDLERYRTEFTVKLNILRGSFPEYNFADLPMESSLDAVHDIYAGYVKQVVVSLNCSQYKIYLVIMFLAIEAFGVKVLKLNMGGFTMSQLRIMNRYDSLLIELGEKYYIGGESSWSAEARLAFMGITSALTFLVVKYLSNYIGGEAAMGPIQAAIDQLMSGTIGSAPSALPSNIPAPPMSAEAQQAQQTQQDTPPMGGMGGGAGGMDIMSMLGGFMGGAGGDAGGGMGDMIAKIGTAFMNKDAPNATTTQSAAATTAPSVPTRMPRFRAPRSS
jgi:hypothetical protein